MAAIRASWRDWLPGSKRNQDRVKTEQERMSYEFGEGEASAGDGELRS